MNKDMSEKTRSAVNLCKVRLENLKDRIEESPEANIVYNRILIEKAVLEDNLKKKPNAFVNKFKKLFRTGPKKHICDWFKN